MSLTKLEEKSDGPMIMTSPVQSSTSDEIEKHPATADTYAVGNSLESGPGSPHTARTEHLTEDGGEQEPQWEDPILHDIQLAVPTPETTLQILARVRYLTWWALGALVLAIPVALSATVLRHVHVSDISLLGLFFYLEMAWTGFWVAYFVAWCLGKACSIACNEHFLEMEEYSEVFNDLKLPIAFALWSIMLWASLPALCAWSQGPCSEKWHSILRKVLLATIIVTMVLLGKSILVEALIMQTALDFLSKGKKELDQAQYLLRLLKKKNHFVPSQIELNPSRKSMSSRLRWSRKGMSSRWLDFKVHISYIIRQKTILATLGKHLRGLFVHPFIDTEDQAGLFVYHSQGAPDNKTVVHDLFEIFDTFGYDTRNQPTSEMILTRDQVWKRFAIHNQGKDLSIRQKLDKFAALWRILDMNDDRQIVYQELEWLVVEVKEAAKNMSRGKKDIQKVVGNLDSVLSVLVMIGVGFIYAAFFARNLGNYLTPLWTTFTGISFAIAGAATDFLAACTFLFAKHPYNVGDRVSIKEMDLVVYEIRLMHTNFRRMDNNKVVQIPHTVACQECIENLSQTKELKQTVTMQVQGITTVEKVAQMNEELIAFLKSEDALLISRYLRPELHLIRAAGSDPETRSVELEIIHKKRLVPASEKLLAKCYDDLLDTVAKILDPDPTEKESGSSITKTS